MIQPVTRGYSSLIETNSTNDKILLEVFGNKLNENNQLFQHFASIELTVAAVDKNFIEGSVYSCGYQGTSQGQNFVLVGPAEETTMGSKGIIKVLGGNHLTISVKPNTTESIYWNCHVTARMIENK